MIMRKLPGKKKPTGRVFSRKKQWAGIKEQLERAGLRKRITVLKQTPETDWSHFFSEHDKVIFGIIRNFKRRTHAKFDEKDAAQEIRIALVKEIKNFDPKRGDMKTFVGRVSQDRLIDHIRAQRTARRHPGKKIFSLNDTDIAEQEFYLDAPRTNSRVLEEASRGENREMVARVFEKLDPLHRDLLRMRYMDEQSIEEISSRLGMSRDKIRGQTKKAIHAFRAAYRSLYPVLPARKAA